MHERAEINLIEAAANGDIESFGELCRRYYSAMAAVAYSILGEHQSAEDAAQETFAQALVRLGKLRNRRKFGFWLSAICRNIAKDMVADKARQIQHRPQRMKPDNPDESGRLIRRAIEQLPVGEKELLVLRYYDGLSYEQIGSVLGLSKASINGRLTRVKRKMKEKLKQNGFPENLL